ncbi:hypothetical protein LCGC14_0578190 [marine sediment metagenome]|uniref:Uncharacterized protein n=1 Tax=marine sediment metagenome TaxID=412755 RepID=A0A0F9UQG5_9ZZZZ
MGGYKQLIEGINRNAASIAAMDTEMSIRLQALETAMKVVAPDFYEAYQFAVAERIAYRLVIAKDFAQTSGNLKSLSLIKQEINKQAKVADEQDNSEAWAIGVRQAQQDIKSGVHRKGPTLVSKA